jgi:hypothetical protein
MDNTHARRENTHHMDLIVLCPKHAASVRECCRSEAAVAACMRCMASRARLVGGVDSVEVSRKERVRNTDET